jgi:hypothetical protein
MKMVVGAVLLLALLGLAGCITPPPAKDYTEFNKSHPRSILVLPPINETTDVNATYSVLSCTTRPLAELGYYVFPVAVVDGYFRENGLTVPADIQQVPLAKLYEVFGADAVLYITIEKYGSKYQIIGSYTYVFVRATIVDCRTGTTLWSGRAQLNYSGDSSSSLQEALIKAILSQVLNKVTDQAHQVASMADYQLLTIPGQGLPKGPRHPEYEAKN